MPYNAPMHKYFFYTFLQQMMHRPTIDFTPVY